MFAGGVTPGKVTSSTATFCTPVVLHTELCANVVAGLSANIAITAQVASWRTYPRAARRSRTSAIRPVRAPLGQRTPPKEDAARRRVPKIAEEVDALFCEMALLASTAMSLPTTTPDTRNALPFVRFGSRPAKCRLKLCVPTFIRYSEWEV